LAGVAHVELGQEGRMRCWARGEALESGGARGEAERGRSQGEAGRAWLGAERIETDAVDVRWRC
jgi:hypothetical protein